MATHDAYELQLWIYNQANSAYRVVPASQIADGSEASKSAAGGFDEATFLLIGSLTDFPDLVRRRRIEWRALWAKESDPETTRRSALLWRGYVHKLRPQTDDEGVARVEVKCRGFWRMAAQVRCNKKYVGGQSTDRSYIASDLFTRFVLPRFPFTVLQCFPLGDYTAELDSRDRLLDDAIEALASDVGQVVYGGGVYDDGAALQDSLFFRPIDAAASHVLNLDSIRAGARRLESDVSKQVTAVRILGGVVAFPNLLAEGCKNNTSFEEPANADPATTNWLTDPSFENRNTSVWTLAGGASFKASGLSEGVAHHGEDMVELDQTGETVEQVATPPTGAASVEGHTIVGQCHARQENPSGPDREIELEIEFQTSGTPVGSVTLSITPDDVWRPYEVAGAFPVGADQVAIRAVGVTGSVGDGVVVDSFVLYDRSAITQPGWTFGVTGTGEYTAIDVLAADRAFHGAYALKLAFTASSGNEAWLRCSETFAVDELAPYYATARVHGVPGSGGSIGALPARKLTLVWLDDAGNEKGRNSQTFAAVASPTDSWYADGFTAQAADGASKAYLLQEFTASGSILLDAYQVTQGDTQQTYYPADTYEKEYRVADRFPSGSLFDEASAVGDLWEVVENEAITYDAMAGYVADALFTLRTPPIARPEITVYGVHETGEAVTTGDVFPGQVLRAIGSDAATILPEPLPVWEVGMKLSGGVLEITYYPQDERKDLARRLREIIKKVGRGGSGRSGSGIVAGGSGGGDLPARYELAAYTATTNGITIPTWASELRFLLQGQGGGGGGGARNDTSGANCTGGGAGSPGGVVEGRFQVADLLTLGATMDVVISSSGAGGAGATSTGTAGSPGSAGGAVYLQAASGRLLSKAFGGGAGGAGQNGSTAGAGGASLSAAQTYTQYSTNAGAAGGAGDSAGGTGVNGGNTAAPGGGGGSLGASNTFKAGGDGGLGGLVRGGEHYAAAAGGASAGAAGAGVAHTLLPWHLGNGGGGGASNPSGVGGAGGAGQRGGGGGGGGAGRGGNGGAGGAGGGGYVLLVWT